MYFEEIYFDGMDDYYYGNDCNPYDWEYETDEYYTWKKGWLKAQKQDQEYFYYDCY